MITYITKHAFGVYSTKPNQKHLYGEGWTREDPYVTQKRADEYSKPLASVTETPNGESSIETYTIMCDRNSQPERGIIIGRLTATNERFVANLSRNDIRSMNVLLEQDSIGIKGMVSTNSSGKSVFKIIEGIKNKSRL